MTFTLDFLTEDDVYVPSAIENERRNRILVSLWAYAYEFENDSLVSDKEFDERCLKINVNIETGNKLMDDFFKNKFVPDTGMWIHDHPELEKLKEIYKKYGEGKGK